MNIGVLAVQGDVREHLGVLRSLGVRTVPVLRPRDLSGVAGIVLPGGESTAMWRIMNATGLARALGRALAGGLPAFGTCAGMVLLATEITNWPEKYFQMLDIAVERNGTGRQVHSFEAAVDAGERGQIPAVFIRAPLVRRAGESVQVLGKLGAQSVWVRQEHLLATSFHPEVTGDARAHDYFVKMCRKER